MAQRNRKHNRKAEREAHEDMPKPGPDCCGAHTAGMAAGQRGSAGRNHGIPWTNSHTGPACGNFFASAAPGQGEVVLDLGSGAGFDSFAAADKVGPSGRVIGIDMNEDMVLMAQSLAEENGYGNVEFHVARIEDVPVADSSVDWVISNCAVNQSSDKHRVFSEALRVLKPGGRILISDVVVENKPEAWKSPSTAWASCVSGAVSGKEFLAIITRAGFSEVTVIDAREFLRISDPEPVTVSCIWVSGVRPSPGKEKEKEEMKKKNLALDNETQLLIAAGAAMAATCIPCLQTIVAMARDAGIEDWKLKLAVKTGQFIKDKPLEMMKASADELLGTHLQTTAGKESLVTCPKMPVEDEEQSLDAEACSCDCSQETGNTGRAGYCSEQA